MEDKMSNKEIAILLNKIYVESEEKIKKEAILNRVYTEKISEETISEKVNAQMNAIKIGISEINSKFKEGSKNYESTKNAILDTMSNYKQALIELSEFYDGKIEQLILRKVELEASLIGAIINEEFLFEIHEKRVKQKESDKVKDTIKNGIRKVLEKISKKKCLNTQVDTRMITELQDGKDIEMELAENIDNNIEKNLKERSNNKEIIEKIEKEIRLTNDEIKRINERKKQALFDAMEIGNKYISTEIRKPKMFKKITRFFVSKFNTSKVIFSSIIEPLNLRIESFKKNELANMKG